MEESQGSLGWRQLLQTSITLIETTKPEKGRGVAQVAEPVHSTKRKQNKTKHSIYKPSHSQTVSGTCANPGTHPTSSVMDHPFLHMSRFPRSCCGEKCIVEVEGKNRAWNVPGGPGIKSQSSSSGSMSSIPGGRTETPHALMQLSAMLQLLSLRALEP